MLTAQRKAQLKKIKFIASCGLCFVLGAFVPLKKIHAQADSPKEVYYLMAFMKSKAGQDPVKMEQDLWKPVHADRVAKGLLDSWTVMQPVFSGPHPYDYITIETSTSMEKLTSGRSMLPSIEKAWGPDKSKYKEYGERTENARERVGAELWVVVDGVSKQVK